MSAKTVAKKPQTSNSGVLHRWNIWLAIVFAAQGLAILIVSAAHSFSITTNFLGVDTLASQGKSQSVLAAGTHHLFDVNPTYVVAAFLFIAAIAHAFAATKLRDFYEKNLKKNGNTIRWIEWAAGSGLMVVAIALVAGMRDISSLVMLFALSATPPLLFLAAEKRGSLVVRKADFSYVVGIVRGCLAWLVLGASLLTAQLFGNLPGYVVAAYAVTALFFAGFVWAVVLQLHKKGKWADFLYGERVFMIWGLLAKTALAWLLFAGVLRP